jgi:hypothetical protein
VIGASEEEVEARLATGRNRASMTEAEREPGMPRLLTTHYNIPSVEAVAYVIVAGTPPQLVAYYQSLIDAGMQYFIVGGIRDTDSVRLFAQGVVQQLA